MKGHTYPFALKDCKQFDMNLVMPGFQKQRKCTRNLNIKALSHFLHYPTISQSIKKYFSNITEVTTKFQNSKKATAQFFSLSLEVEIFYVIASALDIADKFYLIRDTHHPTCIVVVSS